MRTALSCGSSRWFRLGLSATLGVATLTGVGLLAPAAASAQAPTGCAAAQVTLPDGSAVSSPQDFDDDGRSDLAIGVPAASGGGVVDVRYAVVSRTGPSVNDEIGAKAPRGPQRISQSYFGVRAGSHDHFGAASTIVDADGNHCEDLAVGAPGAVAGNGRVVIALGSPAGLTPTGAITLAAPAAARGFGAALAARGSDLWVGAPNQTVKGATQAGAVYHYRLAAGKATLVQTLTQGTFGVAGAPEPGDHFGAVLAVDSRDTVAIGIPDEDVGKAVDAGMVSVARTSASSHLVTHVATFTQNSATVSGTAEKGDHFGAAVAVDDTDVVVGVPGEDIGSIRDAGMMQVLQVSATGKVTQRAAVSQNSPTVSGTPETGDRFGAAVLFDVLSPDSDVDDIAVSSPGESLGKATSTGVVTVLHVDFHTSGSLTITQKLPNKYQGSPTSGNIGGGAESGDMTGASLSGVAIPTWANNADDAGGADEYIAGGAALVITTPDESVGKVQGAGMVSVVGRPVCRPGCGGSAGAVTYEDSTGAKTGEHYGLGASTVSSGGIDTD